MSYQERELSDCAVVGGIQTGPFGSQLKAEEYSTEGVPVIMPKDMLGGNVSTGTIARVPESKAEKLSRHRCNIGDILFARRGEIGRLALITEENRGWLCGTGCLRVRPNSEVVPELLAMAVQQRECVDWLTKNAVGQTMLNLNTEILGALPICLPPLPEQRKIAAILTAWDEALEKLDALIAAQERRKKGLMQQLLSGRRRVKGVGSNPWQRVRMDELLTRTFRPIAWRPDLALSLVSLRRRCGGLFRRPDILAEDYKTQDLHELKTGDFLISKRQVVHGAWGLVTPEFAGSLVSKEYAILVNSAPKRLHMSFFAWLAQTPRMIHLARVSSIGVHLEKLIFDPEVFLTEKIRIPASVDEQRAVADLLDAAERELNLLRTQRSALDQQKRGLMQRLLTGKVRVRIA